MSGPFDVDVDRLRRRRTVKWSLYGPDVLAAWVAEMDFAVAPVVRAALLEAVDREDFGYLPADLSELTEACAAFLASRPRLGGAPDPDLPGGRRAHRHLVGARRARRRPAAR